MTTTGTTIITGPAVTFDPGALRAWLESPTAHGTGEYAYASTMADDLGIDEFYSRCGDGILSGLNSLLNELREDDAQTAWVVADGVRHIDFFRTYDGDGCDGALVYVDLDNGLRLASLHQDHRDFASTEVSGVEAAVEVMTNLAWQANTLAKDYRRLLTTGCHTYG